MKKIDEVSRLTGLSKRTLQYYDDEGILLIKRTEKNHRIFGPDALERIWQILIYKEMGFKLKEIKKLLELSNAQKDIYFIKQVESIKNQIITLKVRMGFISTIRVNGIPLKPDKQSGKTYVGSITEIREEIKKIFMVEETNDENE